MVIIVNKSRKPAPITSPPIGQNALQASDLEWLDFFRQRLFQIKVQAFLTSLIGDTSTEGTPPLIGILLRMVVE